MTSSSGKFSYPSDWLLHLSSILRKVEPESFELKVWGFKDGHCTIGNSDWSSNPYFQQSNLRFFWVSALGALCSLTEGLLVPRTSPTFRPGRNIIMTIKDTMNWPEKAMKISHFNPNQSAPSIYIMIELCYFSLDQWEIRIHLLWGKSFNIPLHCDPHLNQTKWLIFNDLLPLTIPGVLGTAVLPKPKPNANLSLATGQSMKILKICLRSVRGQDKIFVKKWALVDSEAAPLIPVAAALNKK